MEKKKLLYWSLNISWKYTKYKNISIRKIYEIQREISKSREEKETNKQTNKLGDRGQF